MNLMYVHAVGSCQAGTVELPTGTQAGESQYFASQPKCIIESAWNIHVSTLLYKVLPCMWLGALEAEDGMALQKYE